MERSRPILRAAGVMAVAAASVLGSAAPIGAGPPGDAADTGTGLVVGSLAPETGSLAPILDSLRVPVRMAVDEVNAAGGIEGQPVTLLTADEGTTGASARQAVTTLLDGGAGAIVGPASSSTALAVLRDTRGRALVCSGTNAAEALTTVGPRRSDGTYFRTAPPDRFQGPALAELVLGAGHRRVAVIAADDREGDAITARLVEALRDGRAKVPVVARYDPTAQDAQGDDLRRPVRRALASEPDAVVLVAGLDDGARVLRSLVDSGSGPAQLPTYATSALSADGLAALVDPAQPGALQGLTGVSPAASPAAVASPFHEALVATGTDPVFSAHSYDCTILTALAAVRAGSTDPTRMAEAFSANLRGPNDCDTFASCRDLLEAGKRIHYRGASSRFDRFGRFQPTEGVYQPWLVGADGLARDGDPSTQLTVP